MRHGEWQPHSACWLAWPRPERWRDDLCTIGATFEELCDCFVEVCRAIGASEPLRVLVHDDDARRCATRALVGLRVELVPMSYGDIWLRDTAPVFSHQAEGLTAVCAEFNGWGRDYLFDHDPEVARSIATTIDMPIHELPIVFEGGALDVDGTGRAMTTRQCLLNPNRNPSKTEADIERALTAAFGIDSLLWLDEGLINDHTDGHIDTLARFVAPGTVAFMEPQADDPNRDALRAIKGRLAGLELVAVPSPGAITDRTGGLLPASYLNFYIANGSVVVPIYGSRYDDAAVAAITSMFPDRETIALDATTLIVGGGAFHCVTQEQP